MINVHFTVEDIINKFESIMVLDNDERDVEISFLNHEIRSPYQGVLGCINYFLDYSDLKPNKSREEYLARLEHITRKSLDTATIIMNYKSKTESEMIKFSQEELITCSEKLIRDLKSITEYKSLVSDLNQFENLSEQGVYFANVLGSSIDKMIEMYNNHFSSNYKAYDLDATIKKYATKHAQDPEKFTQIEKIDDITYIGPTDYFRGAMLVFRKNVDDHAFKPEKDIYNRLATNFERKMKVWIEPNHEDKLLTVYVQDNGFGISPTMQDKLFKKGASSKYEEGEHGIGLWYVKKFVEKNNGTIGYKTEPGLGTTFYFTMPYDSINESGQYIKF